MQATVATEQRQAVPGAVVEREAESLHSTVEAAAQPEEEVYLPAVEKILRDFSLLRTLSPLILKEPHMKI